MNKKFIQFGVICSIIALITILGVSLGFLVHDSIYSAKVNIMVAPEVAKVKIGEKEYGVSGEYTLEPGEYAVEVSAEGFETKTGVLNAKAGGVVELSLYLLSNSKETENWYNEHAGDALIMGEIISRENLKAVEEMMEREPVLGKLPLTREYYADNYSKYTKYTVSYALDNSNKGFYLIYKDYTGEGQEKISAYLAEMGLNMNDVEIKYEDLVSESLNGHAE